MKKIALVILMLAFLTGISYAGEHCIALTSTEESTVVWAKDKYNEDNGTSYSAVAFVEKTLRDEIIEMKAQSRVEENDNVVSAYDGANPTVQTQVKQLLGLD
jgi:hypothetical protein